MNAPLDPVVVRQVRDRFDPMSDYRGEALDLPSTPACEPKCGRKITADSPEARLLLACLSGVRRSEPDPVFALAARDPAFDWNIVMALAARHRVRPLLWASLASGANLQLARVPAGALKELREFCEANARRNLFLIGELLRLLSLLRSHGIAAAPFKGPMLAMSAYGDPALREAGDLDLLIRRRHILRAKRLLTQHGFHPVFPTASDTETAYLTSLRGRGEHRYLTQHCEHHFIHLEGGVNIDLHWALALREFWLPLRDREVWNWLEPRKFAGREVPGFAPEEMLLVLCINGAKDCWERLDRICDVAALLRANGGLDWERAFQRAARCGATRMVCTGLQLAARLLGAPLPPPAQRRVTADRAVAALCERVGRRLFAESHGDVEAAGAGKSLFHLALRERLHDRIGYCLAHLEPTVGDWAAWPLPEGLRFLHYALRPLRLIRRFR